MICACMNRFGQGPQWLTCVSVLAAWVTLSLDPLDPHQKLSDRRQSDESIGLSKYLNALLFSEVGGT